MKCSLQVNCLPYRKFYSGETGAVWSLTPDDMSVQSLGADPEGIEQLFYCSNGFVNVTPEGKVKLMHKDGVITEGLGVSTDKPACMRRSMLLLISQGEIIGMDVDLKTVVLRERRDLLAIDIDSKDSLVAIDKDYSILEFDFTV